MQPQVREQIERTIQNNRVVLFMKGDRQMPRCGFSARVVEILNSLAPDYVTVDVLSDPGIRDGIKEFSSWPTIPQLYVQGEFVGGCDIVTELFQRGELNTKLGAEQPSEPAITVSESAQSALSQALEGADDFVRVEVSPSFEHGLSIGPKQPGDFEIKLQGITLLLDRMSAARADGLHIDFLQTADGGAFKISNPNEPPRPKPLSVTELKQKLDSNERLVLVDVRSPAEQAIAKIEGARLLDDASMRELLQLDRETTLVFHCHHGPRSQRAAEHFSSEGFRNVYNLTGGIDAWSAEIDPDVPRY